MQQNIPDENVEIFKGVTINPRKESFIKELIQKRLDMKQSSFQDSEIVKTIQSTIKIIANTASYGIYIQVNSEKSEKQNEPVTVYGIDESFSVNQNTLARKEIPAKYFNPILGVFLPAAARLVLAAAESIVTLHRDGYVAYMDTDSIMVLPKHANEIQKFFQKLNPYENKDVQIFKIEDSDDGKPSVNVDDPHNVISNVTVDSNLSEDAFGNEDKITEITFKFTPTQKFDTDVIMVKMWDFKNNSWTNYFYNSIIIDDSKSEISENTIISEGNNSKSEIPNWLKNNARFWAQNQIDDETFIVGIKYLIEQKIMNIPNLQKFQPEPILHFIDVEKGTQHYIDRYYHDDVYRDWFDSNFPEYTIEEAVGLPPDPVIPDWIKNNAKLWTEDMITDNDFLSGIEFLIKNGIIIF